MKDQWQVNAVHPKELKGLLPPEVQGVDVTQPQDFAARIGLQPGDVILRINGIEVATPADAAALAGQRARRWQIDILRQGQPLRLRFRL